MKTKFFSALLFSCLALVTGACNYPAATPTPIVILPVVKTQIAASFVPTDTAVVTPTVTMTPAPTFEIMSHTPTLTLFYNPTATATPSWMDCPLIIELNDTRKGDFLHIRRCEDNLEYDLGPFAKGVYAAGPGNGFIIYATEDGMVYASKIGETQLHVVVNLVRERFFTAINQKAIPKFVITFTGDAPDYDLVLIETKFKQKKIYPLPPEVLE